MKINNSRLLSLLAKPRLYCLILGSSIFLSACGGSTDTAPDIGAAQEQIDGGNTIGSPSNPENPVIDPGTPTIDPNLPPLEQDDPVALIGSVSSYPQSSDVQSADGNTQASLLADEVTNDEAGNVSTLTRADMQPVQALVSLFLLSDVNFQTPVATVKSDSSGSYTVAASDVREYLTQKQLIAEGASDEDVLASFRSLGRLQVRAIIMRERNGVTRAMAIQSLADPADVDETGAPVPVAIDPIVHRVVKVIVDSIRDSVESLEKMGLSPAVVDQLLDTVVAEVVTQIDKILEETADEVIDIPDGLSIDDVVENQEQELELDVEQQQLDQLAIVLDGTEAQPEDSQLLSLESAVSSTAEITDREQSTLESSLNSESQGLLSGFESAISDQLNGSVERTINEAREAGTEDALSAVFGESTDGVAIEQALAAVEQEQEKQSRLSIQRFFLSLGLGVVVEENQAGDAGVIALKLPLPYHLQSDYLPGVAGLGEREIRLFKVGSGELDADSDYTSNPFVQLSVPDEEGLPMPPFKYVPALADVTAQVLPAWGEDDAQQAVEEAAARVFANAQATPEDYQLLDRVDVLHQLRENLHDTTLVSSNVVDSLVSHRDRKIPLKRIAATIAQEFEWIQHDVKLTPQGFPIYSGRSGPLAGGANVVDGSELVRSLSITLGESPVSTVKSLTNRDGFLAQFAPRAVEYALQRIATDEQTDLVDALLEIYPEEPGGYTDLITGAISGEPEPEFSRARDRLARGLTSAIPASMYGQTLNSDTNVTIRSALFFLDFVLRSDYLIDASSGFYRRFEITRADGVTEARFVPDYANVKTLEPIGDVSVAAMMSELLSVTAIDDGDLFRSAMGELRDGLPDIPELSEHQEHSIDAYIDDLGPRTESADAVCAIEKFDGSDPDGGEEHRRLNIAVYEVDYIEGTGDRFKSDRVDATITSQLVDNDKGAYRVYRISGLPTKEGDVYGRDYVIRLEIDSYQNELPELHVYADGFVPEINLCDLEAPLFIGPDQAFFHLPSVGLISGQSRVGFEPPKDSDTVGVDGNVAEPSALYEWVDLSNFEVPGAPLYLTELDESEGRGAGDLRLEQVGGEFRLVGYSEGDVGFARLYGTYVDGQLQLALQQSASMEPLFGLQSIVGNNVRELIGLVAEGQVELSESLFVAQSSTDGVDARQSDLAVAGGDPELFVDVQAMLGDEAHNSGFEPDSLYLFKDRDGRFWVLELRYFDSFLEFDDTERAMIDLGVASINSIGLIDVPNVNYDTALPDPIDELDDRVIEYYGLNYGDWLVLEKPSGYTGSTILPPEILAYSSSGDYDQLGNAMDGVVIRYAGEHFDENVLNVEDIDANFGTPFEFNSIPVRLDAGREGITFVKLSFDKAEKRYVMDPLPQDSAPYITQLNHNDLVAIFDDQSADDGPVYLARMIRDVEDGSVNGFLGIEALRYDSLTNDFSDFDERQVVCFLENDGFCPETYPPLFSSLDALNTIGIVYDNDVDGVPSIFDPNDYDPNIPGFIAAGETYPEFNGFDDGEDLVIESVAGVSDDGATVRALIARTKHIYPGDIESITLKSELFGEDTPEKVVLSCEPPFVEDFGAYTGVRCVPHPVAENVELEIFRQSEQDVSLLMLIEPQILAALGDYVEFSYQINYRAPVGADGLPLFCDTDVCPGRPASSGVVTVRVEQELPVHGQVSVQVQGQEPVELLGLRELNVEREIRVSAAALPGAVAYELTVYCPSSSQADVFTAADYYQPETISQFFAPAKDESGLAVPPEFSIHIPWLAGRQCRLSLESRIETAAGDLAGVSLYVQGGVQLKGTAENTVFIDNEAAFKSGDHVCIEDDTRLTTENCALADSVFTVQILDDQTGLQKRVSLELSDNAISANSNGYARELLQTRLGADARIGFDGMAMGVTPTCGEVTSSVESYSSCESGVSELQAAFAVSADGSEMQSLMQDAMVEGPVNDQGNISLAEPGYYKVIRLLDATESTENAPKEGSAAADVSMGYSELMNIMIEVHESPDGEREVYARFESPGFNDFLDNFEAGRPLIADVPGFVFIRSAQGHDIHIDVRSIVDERVKVTVNIHRLEQFSGLHDLNGDGVSDVEVTLQEGQWGFRFDPSVDGVRDPGMPEDQEIAVDASGYRFISYPVDQQFAEMLVRVGDTEYLVFAEFQADGFGALQVVDQYPIAEELLDPLFDGRDFEEFFPVELSAASPFARSFDDTRTGEELLEAALFEGLPDITEIPQDVSDGNVDDESMPMELAMPLSDQTSGFQADAQRIAGILSGRFKMAQFFRADNFRGSSADAHCFGPQLYYNNHPDGADSELEIDFETTDGAPYASLPHGDLGIWTEYDQATGNACAAAQMNAQLDQARQRTFAGLVTLASVARRLTPVQQIEVSSGAEVSVADRMNALSLPNVKFEQATISLQADTGDWNYAVKLLEDTADGTESYQTSIEMRFNPGNGSDLWDYSGVIRFRIEDSLESSECASSSIEHLSSLAFERQDQQRLKTEYRHGLFCGHGGVNGFDDNGRVDPVYTAGIATDGWISNFSVFNADFNPGNGAGTYAYSWQAGVNDSHSRVLNVGLNDVDPVDGEAWYGFGQSLVNGGNTIGEINGFICNWAGPGSDHTLLEKAQRQSLLFDNEAGLYVVPDGGSNITYAPTVACTYDSDDGGSFLYDRDLDGALADESADSVDVGEGELQPFDLAPPQSSIYFGRDIEEVIRLRGFVKPDSPELTR